MIRRYKVFKLIRIKKELKEVYTSQIIENLALFIIGIFIPAFLIDSGFSFELAVYFMIIQWLTYIPTLPIATKLNARLGVKHTILIRAPILITYLAMVMFLESYPLLYVPAAILGGTSMNLYFTSLNTEYVRTSDKQREGEEAGLYFGLPYISAVVGPVIGALILTTFGFTTLFSISVILVFLSVVPLFLSSDFSEGVHRVRDISLGLDLRKALWYFITGTIYTTDFLFWGLFVFLNFGFLMLGIAASFMGLGMVIFTFILGRRTNTMHARKRAIRAGGFLCMVLWFLRAVSATEIQALLLSFAGGFIIMMATVPLYADFAKFAKKQGAGRSVAFREFWIGFGRSIPFLLLMVLIPFIGVTGYIQAVFISAGILSALLMLFR